MWRFYLYLDVQRGAIERHSSTIYRESKAVSSDKIKQIACHNPINDNNIARMARLNPVFRFRSKLNRTDRQKLQIFMSPGAHRLPPNYACGQYVHIIFAPQFFQLRQVDSALEAPKI